MSDLEDSNIDWLEKSVEYLTYFEYSEFNNLQQIRNGSSGSIVRVNWENTDSLFVLKTFNNNKTTLNEVVNEIKLQKKVDFHDNIIRLCGITKVETDLQTKKYSLVLEYADSGTLITYLSKHFNDLNWNSKYQLALQIASAVECIHKCDIIHCDLHADNIFVHQQKIKLGDFGLSKKIAKTSSNTSKVFGVIPYIDPKSFNNSMNKNQDYELNKKSDVYSVGVLMWLISSGYRPFFADGSDYDVSLVLAIQGGKREEIIDGTPVEYSNLYTECWKHEPNERPDIQDVVSILKKLICSEHNHHVIPDNVIKQKDNNTCNSDEESLVDINNDLSIGSGINLLNDKSLSSNTIIDLKSNLSNTSIQTDLSKDSHDSALSTLYKINNMVIDKLITVIIKKHDVGNTFDQIKQLIDQRILQWNQTTDNLVCWLTKIQYTPQYTWFLGLFYYYKIGNKKNCTRAFELFSKAAADDYPIAQVYLAKCYNDGYGTEQNKNLAFDWYKKAAKNQNIIGQFYLGYCYEFGIGTKKNKNKFIKWYQKARYGNTTAILYLANCYILGKGVEKDEFKAFKYYKILSEKEIPDAQHQLGNCLYNGIGVETDKAKAFYWYEKAANNGNIISKHILEQNYNKKFKNKSLEIKIHKMIYFEGLRQIGINNYYGTGTRQNYKKAFHYFQKAAENENKFAQYNLGNCYKNGEGVEKDEKKAFELFQKSADQEYKDAQFQLGYCYDKGIGTNINKLNAFELYKISAEKGCGDAQNSLGFFYENGMVVENDSEKAIYWYQKASEAGHILAQYNLGLCYLYGNGVEKDEFKAFEYYKKLAEEYSNAQCFLGYLYENGIGTEKDLEKAIYWHQKAADNGNQFAQYNLGICYQYGNGVEKDEVKALEWYKKSAQKYSDAQNKLGFFYENGIGICKDLEKSIYWYQKAAENGNKFAQYNLGRCYQYGNGTEKNEAKAFKCYKKSAEQENSNAQNCLGCFYEMVFG